MTPRVAAEDPAAVARAAAALRRPGAVILIPTETVYGLVCRAADAEARERIYELKHRDGNKRLGVFVSDAHALEKLGVRLSGGAKRLFDRYCPGALTLVVPTVSGGTLGFRVPDHPFAAALLEACGEALCQTSANRSGRPDARNVDAALTELCGEPVLAVDSGPLQEHARASTVVDCTGEKIRILRQGALEIASELL